MWGHSIPLPLWGRELAAFLPQRGRGLVACRHSGLTKVRFLRRTITVTGVAGAAGAV